VQAWTRRGKPVGWTHTIAGSSIVERYSPAWMKDGVDPDAVESSANHPYDVGAVRVEWVRQETPGIATSWWRGVGITRGTFVVESFVDELAAAAKADALAYRLALSRRARARRSVLQIAASDLAGARRCRPARDEESRFASASAASSRRSSKVSVEKDGAVNPTRVWCVVDCGVQVNPDTIRAQMESGIIFGLSAALHGEITIKDGRVEQTNFGDYRVLRINEAPKIDVALVTSPEAPGGVGEPGTSCVMPALANAIFAATGKRIRTLPVAGQASA
jgi:isoquinoline 1-oxidoreductase beta subunit